MKWLLLLVPLIAVAQQVTIDGKKSDLTVINIELKSNNFNCEKYFWSEDDPYFRGQLDKSCIDIRTLEGIPYDVCNWLGVWIAATEWQSAGKRCWLPEEIENQEQCDGFSPQPPGCE
jgi:hypothetical protein